MFPIVRSFDYSSNTNVYSCFRRYNYLKVIFFAKKSLLSSVLFLGALTICARFVFWLIEIRTTKKNRTKICYWYILHPVHFLFTRHFRIVWKNREFSIQFHMTHVFCVVTPFIYSWVGVFIIQNPIPFFVSTGRG